MGRKNQNKRKGKGYNDETKKKVKSEPYPDQEFIYEHKIFEEYYKVSNFELIFKRVLNYYFKDDL